VSLGSAAPSELSEERARRRLSKADTLRQTFGFDDVSLAPGTETLEPADVDLSVEIGGIKLQMTPSSMRHLLARSHGWVASRS
jgi:hypothetical protein